MIQFLLNQRSITTDKPASTTLLDFIRYDENLRGTKIGCREGDRPTILRSRFADWADYRGIVNSGDADVDRTRRRRVERTV